MFLSLLPKAATLCLASTVGLVWEQHPALFWADLYEYWYKIQVPELFHWQDLEGICLLSFPSLNGSSSVPSRLQFAAPLKAAEESCSAGKRGQTGFLTSHDGSCSPLPGLHSWRQLMMVYCLPAVFLVSILWKSVLKILRVRESSHCGYGSQWFHTLMLAYTQSWTSH